MKHKSHVFCLQTKEVIFLKLHLQPHSYMYLLAKKALAIFDVKKMPQSKVKPVKALVEIHSKQMHFSNFNSLLLLQIRSCIVLQKELFYLQYIKQWQLNS